MGITPALPHEEHAEPLKHRFMTFDKFGGRGIKKHTWLPEASTFIKMVKAISLSRLQIMTYMKNLFHHFHPFKKIVGFRVPGTSFKSSYSHSNK